MKKLSFFLLLSLIAFSPLRLMAETVPATDSRITFVGRSVVEDGSYRFDFPSTYFRVAFTGKKLSMRVTDTKRNYYAVFVNTPTSAEPTRVVEVKGTDTIIDLVLPADIKSLKTKEYQVVIQRRTEANCGTTTVKEFITDGKFLQAEPLKTVSHKVHGKHRPYSGVPYAIRARRSFRPLLQGSHLPQGSWIICVQ